jgi:hypothetical protein
MRRPVRRSGLIAVASLAMLVGTTVLTVSPAALAAGPKSEGAHDSALTQGPDGEFGSRGSVDVSKLAGPAKSNKARPQLPYLSNPSLKARPAAPSGSGQVKPFVATPPVPVALTSGSDAGGPQWDGLSFADALSEPPDPWVGVGPEHVVQSVNTMVQMFDRVGTSEVGPTEIGVAELFALPPNFNNSDPRFIYDSLHGRWVGTEVSWTCDIDDDGTANDPVGFLDFVVSRTADPTGLWDVYFFGYFALLPDYPAPGTSTDKLAFTANFFTMEPTSDCTTGASVEFEATAIVITDWAEVLAGSGGVITDESLAFSDAGNFLTFFTARAAVQVPATSATLHVIAQHTGTAFGMYYARVTGTVAAGTIAVPFETDLTTAEIVAESIEPPDPTQPAGGVVTTAIDFRPTDAIWQNGLLTWVSTNGCTPTGDTLLRACVRVTQLNTSGAAASPPTRTQDFLIGDDGKHNYFGGVGQSGNGTLHVVWTNSSTTAGDEPSSQTAYQLPTDGADTLKGRHEIGIGTGGTFTGGRWGDYVGVAQDPQVPNAVWQANQFSTGGDNWETKVSQLQTGGATYVAIDPLRVLDSRVPLGVTGIFNASSPRTFAVAGVGTIPADAIAVTGNLTVVGQTAAGYVSITTAATSTPRSATLNFPMGDTRGNNVTTPLAGNGRLAAVYKAAAGKKAHLIFDVTGYFLPGTEDAGYNTVDPVRMLDSRAGIGTGLTGRFVSGMPRELPIAGAATIPGGAVAITANLTVVGQTKGGFVSLTPTSVPNPSTANLNFPVGDTRGNGLTAKLSGTGTIFLVYKAAAGARTDLILDVTGYYLPSGTGLAFFPLDPGRIVDTRSGAVLSGLTGSLLSSSPRTLDTAGHWGVGSAASAVTGNLTITGQTHSGYVSITPTPNANPTTSTINFPLGDTRGNGVTVPLNSGDMSFVYKGTAGKRTHVILDVTGYFE